MRNKDKVLAWRRHRFRDRYMVYMFRAEIEQMCLEITERYRRKIRKAFQIPTAMLDGSEPGISRSFLLRTPRTTQTLAN